jgi:hypothetical protein
LFQCAVPLRWEPQRLLDVLVLGTEERARAAAVRDESAVALDASVDEVEAALVAQLPP